MRIRSLLHAFIAVLTVSLAAGLLAGCTGEPPSGPVDPGVEKGSLGGVEVVGYLIGLDSESGDAWTVYAEMPGSSSSVQPKALATLIPGSVDQGGIAALEGRFIWAAGRGSSGSVPEIRVDGIEIAEEKP